MKRRARRSSRNLLVLVTDARGRALRTAAVAGLGRWLSVAAPAGARGAVTIAIVPDSTVRRLNRRYRGKDNATDVLSFVPVPGVALAGGRRFLGDLAIAKGLAARQARALGHSLRTEFRVLALHGLLHLLGYDHETDRGEMGRLENRLRRRARLPAGLISRH